MPLMLKERDYGIYVYQLPATAAEDYVGTGKCVAYAIKLVTTGEYMVRKTGDYGNEQIVPSRTRAIEVLQQLFRDRFFVVNQ